MKRPEVVKAAPGCRLVQAGSYFTGEQNLQYAFGVSAESVGAQGIHMQLVTIPPGGRALAHKHIAHETALYMLGGESGVWHGERLEHHTVLRQGDFFYIPANMPHQPYNPSLTEPVLAVIARTDPNQQESVVLLPELESIHPV
jgi:uncharacterized RmlC-like cupin family protein